MAQEGQDIDLDSVIDRLLEGTLLSLLSLSLSSIEITFIRPPLLLGQFYFFHSITSTNAATLKDDTRSDT